ncbi:MAG: hypothetical protein Q3X03_02405 [Eggerthellaceae bacterium]|jgi:hypothetical protein|nr:hypothetical protein [Eggerthellaceae bacterium]
MNGTLARENGNEQSSAKVYDKNFAFWILIWRQKSPPPLRDDGPATA